MTASRPTVPIWGLNGLLVLGATALWILGPIPSHGPSSFVIWWPLMALAFVATELLVGHVEFGGEACTIDVGAVPLLVGLAYCAPVDLLGARLLGYALVLLLHFRQPAVKLVFNLAMTALEFGVAVLVYHAVLGGASIVSPQGWLAGYAAAFSAYACTTVCMIAVLSLSLRRFTAPATLFIFSSAMTFINAGLGLLAVLVISVDWRALWLIAGALVTAAIAYRMIVRLRRRYDNLQLLYHFTNALSGTTDTREVTDRALRAACELLRAEFAEVVLETQGGPIVRRVQAGNDGMLLPGEPSASLLEAYLLAERSLVAPEPQKGGVLADLMAEAGWRDLVCSPLGGEGAPRGVLVVGNRLTDIHTFDREDLTLLETFASHATVALRVGDLVDELRAEAVSKEFQALHDGLTGLANRIKLTNEIETLVPAATLDSLLAVYFLDLDSFKDVNDTLGHQVGDELLQEVARRLVSAFGSRGVVGRFGGDEFALIVPDLPSVAAAQAYGARIRTVVEEQFPLGPLTVELGVSVGAALAPIDGADPRTLFRLADVAMYEAKERRTGVELYDAAFDHATPRRLSLSADLHHAIDARELTLHYQPQIDMATGRIVAFEALARWLHPRYGPVPPDEFVPIAERSGLIHGLTRWAIDTALADLAEWRRDWPNLTVSVNLSAQNLVDTSFVADVARLLAWHHLPADALTLELVESSVMSDSSHAPAALRQLHEIGLRLAIDDFGTGYSSLSYLKRLPVHEIKIDKSFVLPMTTDPDDAVIVRSTIELARNLGLGVVAEGVEDVDTRDRLMELGCERIQGYLISRPRPRVDVPAMLMRYNAPEHAETVPSDGYARTAVASGSSVRWAS